jgi:hypothetical protein
MPSHSIHSSASPLPKAKNAYLAAHAQHVFHAQAAKEPGDEEHAEQLRHLSACHFSRGVVDSDFVEIQVRERVIKLQGYADEQRRQGENGHRPAAQQPQ